MLVPLLAASLALAFPSAPAGEAQPVSQPPAAPLATALIELDGSDSESPDGGELQYEWRQIEGPKVELSDPAASKPYFRTGQPGFYRFQLVVTANGLKSNPHIVELMIERENQPPVAKAPREVRGEVGKLLAIDGRESYDPDGTELTYRWRPLTRGLDIPPAELNRPVLSFQPAVDGVFEVELAVSDGELTSPPVIVRLIVKPQPRPPVARGRAVPKEIPTAAPPEQAMAPPGGARPAAHIAGPTVAPVGNVVMLDARGSRSPGNSRLEYLWRQKSGPFIGDFELIFDGAAERFRPPKTGDYEFELVVSDGSRESDPALHRLRVVKDEDPPVAVVTAPTKAVPDALVKLDATQSYDLGGSRLSYHWRQTGGPRVTNYVIDEKLGDSAPAFHPRAPGTYSFELKVSNGRRESKAVEINIEVAEVFTPPGQAIRAPVAAGRPANRTTTPSALGNARQLADDSKALAPLSPLE
ncbi:MAG: hypothetical protein LBV15_05860 [Planctomycetota bacterium]|nr:hypothetical protein [Planctomycetota bacterium]